jgi:ABC-type sugar transport system ATPase subunit
VTKNIREISNEEIVKYMVGREVTNYYTREFNVPGGTVLEVKGLASEKVRNVSFSLRAGEILGFAGIVGAGRTETIKAILGLDKRTSGEITINGRTAAIKRPVDAYNLGIGFIPESRREESIFPEKSVKFNLVIKVLSEFISGARVSFVKEKEITDTYIKKLSVKTASHNALIKNLSGGNQQKVVIASWLAAKPKILIMDEPTRGIDVGAKAEIYALMNALAREGIGIIMISSELPEIINMSDRVLVMKDGEITRELSREEISQETIMRYAVDI